MAQNSFEAVIGDRAPALLNEFDSEYTQVFLNLYEDTAALIAQGSPIPIPLPHVWHRELTHGDEPDETNVPIPGFAAKFYGADQDFPLSGRPWLKRLITIQIRPSEFALGTLARNELGYRMSTGAASTLELRLDAKIEPYAYNESRLFDLSWKLTKAEGTETLVEESNEPLELAVVETVINAANDIKGTIDVSCKQTSLRFVQYKNGDEEHLESERSTSTALITPETILEESKFHVVNPATRLLQAAAQSTRSLS